MKAVLLIVKTQYIFKSDDQEGLHIGCLRRVCMKSSVVPSFASDLLQSLVQDYPKSFFDATPRNQWEVQPGSGLGIDAW
jgi:hypothetical protein